MKIIAIQRAVNVPWLKELSDINSSKIELLPQGRTVIGRGPECSIVLRSYFVGRFAVFLEVTGEASRLQDAGHEGCPVHVNSTQLSKCASCQLQQGDIVAIGPYWFGFNCGRPSIHMFSRRGGEP